jgi:hypothetical protein
MKTVVMKRSDREKKTAMENYPAGVSGWRPEPEDYPDGMRISLDDGTMKKLGIEGMPKPGDKFNVVGEAHVTSAEQRDIGQNLDRRVGLVLHKFGAEPKGTEDEEEEPPRTVRQDLEDARHQARGTTAPVGRIGAGRQTGGESNGC